MEERGKTFEEIRSMYDESTKLWAAREFGNAELGDSRRTNRLVLIAEGLASNIGGAVSLCCGKMGAQLVSNFFNQEEVTVSSVLEPHIQETAKRCAGVARVFALQDTTTLNYSTHNALGGRGPIGAKAFDDGFIMHTVMAVTPDRTPLGVLGLNIWARNKEEHGKRERSRTRPIEEKESFKWLWGLMQAEAALPEDTPVVVIGDRESDLFALFACERRANTDILVRCCYNRSIHEESGYLFKALDRAAELGIYRIKIPRRENAPAREAVMKVSLAKVRINPPRERTVEKYVGPVVLTCVWVKEIDAPDGVAPVDWKLLTTLKVESFDDAVYAIKAYSCRWVIEEFHRVLKSGCKIERMQFETPERLFPAIAVLSVVAWRVLYLSKFGRENPEGPASLVSEPIEREVLGRWLRSQKDKSYIIVTVKDFVRGVAKLGGFMGRKSDGNPGTKVLWQGLRRLEDLVAGFILANIS